MKGELAATLSGNARIIVIEIAAAVVGASLTVAAMGAGSAFARSREGRDNVIRLTTAVENVASRLEQIHVDIKEDRKEVFSRLSDVEQRVSKLEVRPPSF